MKIARATEGEDVKAIESGDVIEFRGTEGSQSALVLLASDNALIIDLCDGSTPMSVLASDLEELRVFDPVALQIAA